MDESSNEQPISEKPITTPVLNASVKGGTKAIWQHLASQRFDPNKILPANDILISRIAISAHRSGRLIADVKKNSENNELAQAVSQATAVVAASKSSQAENELAPAKNKANQLLLQEDELAKAIKVFGNEMNIKLSEAPKEFQGGKSKNAIRNELDEMDKKGDALAAQNEKLIRSKDTVTAEVKSIRHNTLNMMPQAEKSKLEASGPEPT